MKKVYLAGPFFSPEQRDFIAQVATFLRKQYDVFVPMEHFIENGEMMPNAEWGKAVFDMDVEAIRNADFAVVCDYGFTSDAGTAWEAGYLYALNIPTFIISAIQEETSVHSLMLVNGCTNFFATYDDFQEFILSNNVMSRKIVEQK